MTLGASALFLALFVYRCLPVAAPALDLRAFQVPTFTVATLGMAFFYMGFAIMLLGGTLYLTQVWRWDSMIAGAAFGIGPATAVGVALFVAVSETALHADQYRSAWLLMAGFGVMACLSALLLRTPGQAQ